MTEFISSTGVKRDIDLDLDLLCEYETAHPDWSVMDLIQKMERVRFTDMNLMARFLGFVDYKEVVDDGFTFSDMAEMVQNSKYLGFTDSPSNGE